MHSSRVFFAASAGAIEAAISANAKTTKMPIPILKMTSHSLQSANSAAVQLAAQGKSRVVGDDEALPSQPKPNRCWLRCGVSESR
jgi:hypothetical protein